jgi:hypothetical protein
MRSFLLTTLLLVLGSVAGCSSNRQSVDSQPPQARDGQGNGPQTSPSGSNSMSPGFSKAHAAVREYAAKHFGVKPDTLRVMPDNEGTANLPHMGRVGKLWSFDAQAGDDTITVLAAPDGRVASHQQNLGLLFEEAGVWTDSATLNADQLAAQIVESMGSRGMNYRVYDDFGASAPELTIDASGAGTLVFQVGRKQRGPGGSGGGPEFRAEAKVVLTPDHQAKLELGEWRNPW